MALSIEFIFSAMSLLPPIDFAIEETIAVSPWKVPMRPSDTDTDAASLVCESMIFFAFSVFTEKTHINKNIIKG
ncbi:hypothetical protein IBH21_004720 [Salmonella enterica subsp. enterica serovar Kentucky]|nr:hypothetical protein [Salmonella enterica subsp. enterica serovar Kentucky]EGD5503898.1 hypothetical protein [Salmonella enterica subsp. enterica serovar Kentucky]EGF8047941.1 hypothetical protein [Salmonella enterica subsp. enterica serovar Kentucky]EJX0563696.1 hypothetical protein [Salmonella enterica subsp. enterica serovar Kentucky]